MASAALLAHHLWLEEGVRRRLALSSATDVRDAPRPAAPPLPPTRPPVRGSPAPPPPRTPSSSASVTTACPSRVSSRSADAQSKLVLYAKDTASNRRGSALSPDLLRDWEVGPWPTRAGHRGVQDDRPVHCWLVALRLPPCPIW